MKMTLYEKPVSYETLKDCRLLKARYTFKYIGKTGVFGKYDTKGTIPFN
jgi:hypothetical protein